VTIGALTATFYAIAIPVAIAVFSAIGTLIIGRLGDAASRRRDRYAQAVGTLVAWLEFPYRIRRRVDDEPATLSSLAVRGNDLQEQLASDEVWIVTESQQVAVVYREVRSAIGKAVNVAAKEAWNLPPAAKPSDMVLGPWGPNQSCKEHLERLQQSVQWRFGWRRLRLWRNRKTPIPS
jgi:hypothetical protein